MSPPRGPLHTLLMQDHSELEELLQREDVDLEAYAAFRRGLLRHIAIEEKVLLPEVCLNVMDAHDPDGFEQRVVPQLQAEDIGILGMKSLGGGVILDSKIVSATECIQYVMSLPITTLITGCDSQRTLRQSIAAAQGFKPWDAARRAAVLAKTKQAAEQRRYEKYKTSDTFDDTDRNPAWVS